MIRRSCAADQYPLQDSVPPPDSAGRSCVRRPGRVGGRGALYGNHVRGFAAACSVVTGALARRGRGDSVAPMTAVPGGTRGQSLTRRVMPVGNTYKRVLCTG